MVHPTAVLNVVGLTPSLIGEHTPRLRAFVERGRLRHLEPVLPAVTCTVQSSMLTGRMPGGADGHGIVANGWYNPEYNEVHFWKQSNDLVQGPKIWDLARERDASVTVANLFWWYNMYARVDYSVTPRPMYKADGRKIPDCYSHPAELRDTLQSRFGQFPLFRFWGPAASIESSRWIADAAMHVHRHHAPTLTLVYLPHLDYCLQKLGPGHPDVAPELRLIDAEIGRLIDYFDDAGVRIMIVSEYGIEPVTDAVHINQALRRAGALRVREEQGLELLDAGASGAFAVADHQVAHVYVRDVHDRARIVEICGALDGVDEVLTADALDARHLSHTRSGDLLLVADRGRWFSYDYWLDDRRAPDFARTVDIHRKPGYDPLELFIDPTLALPKIRIASKILRKKLGFRTLLDVIPLDTSLVRGSHGRTDLPPAEGPVLITDHDLSSDADTMHCTAVAGAILDHLFDPG